MAIDDPTAKANRLNESNTKTKYPYNQVMVTEAGHEVHFDNTPGKERIRFAHKDGTYIEITPGGKRVDFTVGNAQQYHKGGLSLTVDENSDVKIHGHQRVLVGGGSHVEVSGDAAITVGGDSTSVVGGNMQTAVAGSMHLLSADSININSAGNINMDVTGNMNMKVGGNWNVGVSGQTEMASGADHVITASNIRLN